MTTAQPQKNELSEEESDSRVSRPSSDQAGSTLAIAFFAGVPAVLLLLGSMLMRVPEASGFLGPRFFPVAVGIFLMVTALIWTAWSLHRKRSHTRGSIPKTARDSTADNEVISESDNQVHSNWRTLAIMATTMVGHVVLLQPLGWLISGTLLFWGVSYALDHRRPFFDLCIAAAMAGTVQLAFSGLLDIALPAGILGKVL
ncbi:tripartite tricarboxylate transporter TctB family protein [Haloactinomyces albus]|uniref:Tricarboxylic transport membrane protein n=1 Tax=Haloactinomyces albus TaxID=1352928 RepID=A0AAE4CNM9_9ACTN|nr:tripartite tricarboxylate transporter TctB family protein [Haloactinomyces albus]MDR7303641.1 putative tricarboxylic transport membrane protein [Haloactinomyces albus]